MVGFKVRPTGCEFCRMRRDNPPEATFPLTGYDLSKHLFLHFSINKSDVLEGSGLYEPEEFFFTQEEIPQQKQFGLGANVQRVFFFFASMYGNRMQYITPLTVWTDRTRNWQRTYTILWCRLSSGKLSKRCSCGCRYIVTALMNCAIILCFSSSNFIYLFPRAVHHGRKTIWECEKELKGNHQYFIYNLLSK